MNKNHIKCLPLDFWMEIKFLRDWDKFRTVEGREITPKFNRDGWYYDRSTKECWFESSGYAFKSDINVFKFELERLNHERMTDRVYLAFCILRQENKLGEEYLRQLEMEEDFFRKPRKSELDMYKSRRNIERRKKQNDTV